MNRRGFFKVIAGGTVIAVSPALIKSKLYAENSNGECLLAFERVQLVDEDNNPLKYDKLQTEEAYAFNYPHKGTPSILIKHDESSEKDVKLKSEDGNEYIWKGGVGKGGDLVAYSAICPHQLTHPTPETSFISYIKKGQKTLACKRDKVLVCASHLSAFDPKAGCKVVGGPAPQPFASIVLEVDDDNNIFASAVLGQDKFVDYFKAYKPELKKFYGGKRKAKRKVKESAEVIALSKYSKEIITY
jgi:Rieske Fe-S protein